MPTFDEARRMEQQLAQKLRKLRQLTRGKTESERDRDAARKREVRAAAREIEIPPPQDLARRQQLEADTPAWLRHYFGHEFTRDFTGQQLDMIDAIDRAAIYGGDQAMAAPRGEGKSMIAERVTLKNLLSGRVRFGVIFSATADDAKRMLENVKELLSSVDRLAADYPEVCVPVRALEGIASRARGMLVTGHDQRDGRQYYRAEAAFSWAGRQIRLPNVPGSRASGSILATRGLDGAVLGLRVGTQRPDLAVIDDPDTDSSAHNEVQAAKLERRIEQTIGGLAGQQHSIARVMLTTIHSLISASARYTDRKKKPSWQGRRYKFLVRPPDREDLWDEFVMTWLADQENGDPHSRRAHQFYLDHREEMDRGAEIANPHRFDATILPDGSQLESSALEHFFVLTARLGDETIQTQYQNDPPQEAQLEESGLTPHRVQRQVSGYDRKIVPPGCTVLVQGMDVRKIALHFAVLALRPDATGYVVDYGVQEVLGTTAGSDEGVDRALVAAIAARMEAVRGDLYHTVDGVPVPVDLTLVDAGWQTEAIYHACRELAAGAATPDVRPAMGFGKSSGCVQARFTPPLHPTPDKKLGDRWFLSRRPKGTWLVCSDADHWKSYLHNRFLTATDKPGTLFLFGQPSTRPDKFSDDQKRHFNFAKHVTAECEVEELVRGVLVRRWKAIRDTNHYLDATYMACVAGSMKGIRLMREPAARTTPAAGGWFKAQEGRRK